MDRDTMIQQVKSEYQRLAEQESRAHITEKGFRGVPPEVYYEHALEKAIHEISAGKYDDFISGLQVVDYITKHRTKAQRIQDTIENTLHNMEIAEEMLASIPDGKQAQDLRAENERRADVIPQMIREMKEEQAREELDRDSPNVIGGGGNG